MGKYFYQDKTTDISISKFGKISSIRAQEQHCVQKYSILHFIYIASKIVKINNNKGERGRIILNNRSREKNENYFLLNHPYDI